MSLWYAIGGEYVENGAGWEMTAADVPRSLIIASEPLTSDHSSWLEVPEYSMLIAEAGLRRGARVRGARPRCLSRRRSPFSPAVPLLEGRDADDLAELAGAMRRRRAAAGDVLWSEGDEARELLFVLDGEVGVSLGAPGGRTVEIGRVGPGGVVGEIGLLEGGKHTMTVRATEPTTLLTLSRHDFAALLAAPGCVVVRAEAKAGVAVHRPAPEPAPAARGDARRRGCGSLARSAPELEACGPPDSRYLSRMATFHDFDPVALWGFLTSGSYAMCPPGRTLLE